MSAPNPEPSTIITVTLLLTLLTGGCSSPPPTEDGAVQALPHPTTNAPLGESETAEPLVMHWLGTASFHIRAGATSILTDPFYSHQTAFRTAFRRLESNPERIQALLGDLPEPQAILIGHGHYDHIMDLAPAMRLLGWRGTEVFGSETVDNLLQGYPEKHRWRFNRLTGQTLWRESTTLPLRLRSLSAGHAPQIGNRLLWPGQIGEQRKKPPAKVRDFQAGRVLAYFIELDAGAKTHRIVFLSSAPTLHRELARRLRASSPIDVLILPVASWDKVEGYPGTLVRALEPRYIVLSHFNDLFDRQRPQRTLRFADLDGMLKVLQQEVGNRTSPGFERIIVPDIKAELLLR
jgi:L-ascorbate metabolism protein UlaG (beta-lactamase superfamily)